MTSGASLTAVLAAGLLLAGCVAAADNPYPAPPPPRTEVVPPPPANTPVLWQPGHYHWNGAAYIWVPGRYVSRVAGMNRWEPGHWANRGGAWVWVPGHWV